MQNSFITGKMLDEWFSDIVDYRPQAMSVDERADAHDCIAACFHPDREAAFVRLVTASGINVDLRLNPAMVQVLREALLVCGTTAGWMDEEGRLLTKKPVTEAATQLRVA